MSISAFINPQVNFIPEFSPPNNSNYSSLRKSSESSIISYSLGINIHKNFSKSFSFIIGIHSFNYQFQSNYNYFSISDSNVKYTLSDTFTNSIHYIEFPFLIEKKFELKKFDFGIRLGPKLGLLNSAFLSLPSADLKSFRSMDKNDFSKLNIGLSASLPFYFFINNSLNFQVEPNFQYYFQGIKGGNPSTYMNLFSIGIMTRIVCFL